VQLKVRFADFRTITRARTLLDPTAVAADIAHVARIVLDDIPVDGGVRLLGVSVSRLGVAASATQPRLFALTDDPPELVGSPRSDRRAALERSVDAVRARFGPGAVGPGISARRTGEPTGRRLRDTSLRPTLLDGEDETASGEGSRASLR
jgi:DNA polymerase-4